MNRKLWSSEEKVVAISLHSLMSMLFQWIKSVCCPIKL